MAPIFWYIDKQHSDSEKALGSYTHTANVPYKQIKILFPGLQKRYAVALVDT